MNPSRMALLSLGGVVAATIVVIAVAARVTFGQGGQVGAQVGAQVGSSPGELSSLSHDLSGFDSIEINGRWTVIVTQGDEWHPDETASGKPGAMQTLLRELRPYGELNSNCSKHLHQGTHTRVALT